MCLVDEAEAVDDLIEPALHLVPSPLVGAGGQCVEDAWAQDNQTTRHSSEAI